MGSASFLEGWGGVNNIEINFSPFSSLSPKRFMCCCNHSFVSADFRKHFILTPFLIHGFKVVNSAEYSPTLKIKGLQGNKIKSMASALSWDTIFEPNAVTELSLQGTIAWALRHHSPFDSLFTVVPLGAGVDGSR